MKSSHRSFQDSAYFFRQDSLLYPLAPLVTRRARASIQAMSESQFEKREFPLDPSPAHKVAVIGAGSDIGAMASFCLKLQPVIKSLTLYDDEERDVLTLASDLAHIDTCAELEACQASKFIKDALVGADVVLICGGYGCNDEPDKDEFFKNLRFVRKATLAVTQHCPDAIIAVQTPPVDCTFALCTQTLKSRQAYDRRRVLGVNAVNAMRANQLYSTMMGTDPTSTSIPVVGGTGRLTRVPVFSAAKPNPFACSVTQDQLDGLTKLVRNDDYLICDSRSNAEMKNGAYANGFATARFVTNIVKGLFENPIILESALVDQSDPANCFGMAVCSTPVLFGPDGIQEYQIPIMTETEEALLEKAKGHLDELLNVGRSYADGDNYYQLQSKYEMP